MKIHKPRRGNNLVSNNNQPGRKHIRSNREGKLIAENSRGRLSYLPQWIQAAFVALIAVTAMLATTGAFSRTEDTEVKLRNIEQVAVEADEVKSAEAASAIAERTDIIIRNNVVNYADTLNAQVSFISDQELTVDKPVAAVIDEATNREVANYTAVAGDTVSDLAARFDVSSDSIRWANGIEGDAINVGAELRIPPVTGIFHKVVSGETADGIADKYKAVAESIVSFNNAEIDGLPVGEEIFVPNGVKPAPVVRPTFTVTAPTSQASSTVVASGIAFNNNYARGYCTWHAAHRRAQIGRPVPASMGHAVSWGASARAAGYVVDGNPQAGDVAWKTNGGWGGYGHVAFVERVNPDGTVLISEMNYAGGWNRVSNRILQPSQIGTEYQFIH